MRKLIALGMFTAALGLALSAPLLITTGAFESSSLPEAAAEPQPLPKDEHEDEQADEQADEGAAEEPEAEPAAAAEDAADEEEMTPEEEAADEGAEADDGAAEEMSDDAAEAAADEAAVEESAEEVVEAAPLTEAMTAAPLPVDVLIEIFDIERETIRVDVAQPTRLYTVANGDSLMGIADAAGTTVDVLMELNALESPDHIEMGMELIVPHREAAGGEAAAPVEVAPGRTDAGVIYGTIGDRERGLVDSAVAAFSDGNEAVSLVAACLDGALRLYLRGVAAGEPDGLLRVYWRADGGALATDRWDASGVRIESHRPAPLMADLAEAQTLWLRLSGQDLTFQISGMFQTAVQPNLDSCSS